LSIEIKNSNQPITRHDVPLGASGTDVVGRIHNADDHIELLQGFEASTFYDKMRRSDTQVRKVLAAINYPIKAAEWKIEPASDDAKDIEIAALIDQILFKDISFSKFLHEALTFFLHGFSAFEIVHQNKDNKSLGQYTGLAQLGFRKQNTVTEWYHNSITGALEKIKQEANGDIEVSAEIPAEFLLLFFNEQEGDNIGFPIGRILYGPYKRKLIATELQYIGTERFAIPTPILKVPKKVNVDDAEYIQAINVLKNFTSAEDSYLIVPEGWDLELHNNTFDPVKLNALIKSEDEKMVGAILATFLELGIGGNGGAYSLGNDLSDFFLSGLESIANTFKDTINTCLIPQLVKLNYGDDFETLPELNYSGISDKAGKEIMEIITGYTNASVINLDEQLEDHVRKIHKLPKKVEGTMLDNQESESDGNTNDNEPSNDDDNSASLPIEPDADVTLKLAETTGHTHKGTGPAISRGQKHYHEFLDGSGRTKTEADLRNHVHIIDGDKETSKPIISKEVKEIADNPKALIESIEPAVTNIIRTNLKIISAKYIDNIMKNYEKLGDKQKLNATKNINLSGISNFRKELKAEFTGAAKQALRQARQEIPNKKDVKLSYDMDILKKKYDNAETFKFTDFSEMPRHIQILVANQAQLISDKEAGSIADTVAFQFNSSESSTSDIELIRSDLEIAAEVGINSGTKESVGTTATSTIVNEARNEFILSDEVVDEVASFTFVNSDPKASICIKLAGTVYSTSDRDLIRHQPPLHQNCKSYLRANLKSSSDLPNITGLPPISDADKKSITLKGYK
jgi:hypothetical protein